MYTYYTINNQIMIDIKRLKLNKILLIIFLLDIQYFMVLMSKI